jgi:hypothetical protein
MRVEAADGLFQIRLFAAEGTRRGSSELLR